jgi:hypothetical protein
MKNYDEFESNLRKIEANLEQVLPNVLTEVQDEQITALTKELIGAGNIADNPIDYTYAEYTRDYTHSVCHLFEHYPGSPSYLYATGNVADTEALVNFTLQNAVKAGDFSCVGRIIDPIMNLNLAHMDQDESGFIFRPEILRAPEFVKLFSTSEETTWTPYLADFCTAKSIGEFFPAYVQALQGLAKLPKTLDLGTVLPGVFMDVEGTFIEYDGSDDLYKQMPKAEAYSLRKLRENEPVIVFTGGNLENARQKLENANVASELSTVRSKFDFLGKVLEIVVDDTAPAIQGFRAKKHYWTAQEAWYAEYGNI